MLPVVTYRADGRAVRIARGAVVATIWRERRRARPAAYFDPAKLGRWVA